MTPIYVYKIKYMESVNQKRLAFLSIFLFLCNLPYTDWLVSRGFYNVVLLEELGERDVYDWCCFDRYSRQINAFTMVMMEIYLYTCHNILTNVYYGSANCLAISVGMRLKIFRLKYYHLNQNQ